jgi:hypothetical protein
MSEYEWHMRQPPELFTRFYTTSESILLPPHYFMYPPSISTSDKIKIKQNYNKNFIEICFKTLIYFLPGDKECSVNRECWYNSLLDHWRATSIARLSRANELALPPSPPPPSYRRQAIKVNTRCLTLAVVMENRLAVHNQPHHTDKQIYIKSSTSNLKAKKPIQNTRKSTDVLIFNNYPATG